jgi:hypothetical protein
MSTIHSMPPTLHAEGMVEPDVTSGATKESTARAAPSVSEAPGQFERLMTGIGKEFEHGESVNEAVKKAQGKKLDAAELLALQSEVYRYSQTVDMTSKIVDGATHNVKTVLQSGGQ